MAGGIPPTTINVFGDTSDAESKLTKVHKNLEGLGASATKATAEATAGFNGFSGSLLKVAGAIGLVVAGAAGVSKAIGKAADAETLKLQFETILGSAEAATKRFDELAKFAAATPFELPEIGKASKVLETLTKGALSTGDGLRLVGDVAAATGEPFADLAVHVGRLYDGLQSGRAVGEAMARLQELGILSADTRAQIEKLQASGQKGDAVWALAAAQLGKFGGSMEKLSGSWSGMMSTLSDNIGALFKAFGQPLIDALKPILKDGLSLTESLVPAAQAAGEAVGRAITRMVQMVTAIKSLFASGELGEAAFTSLALGFKKAINLLVNGLILSFNLAGAHLVGVFKAASSPEFWIGLWEIFQGVGAILVGAGTNLIAALVEGLRFFVDPIVAAFVWVGAKLTGTFQLVVAILKQGMAAAAQKFLEVIDYIPGVDTEDSAAGMGGTFNEAGREVDAALDVFNTSWEDSMGGAKEMLDTFIPAVKDFGNAAANAGTSGIKEGATKLGNVLSEQYIAEMTEAIKGHKRVTALDETPEMTKLREMMGKFFSDSQSKINDASVKSKQSLPGGKAMTSVAAEAVGDSLASIGGGGGLFGGGLSGIASEQLSIQKSMDTRLGAIHNAIMSNQLVVSVK